MSLYDNRQIGPSALVWGQIMSLFACLRHPLIRFLLLFVLAVLTLAALPAPTIAAPASAPTDPGPVPPGATARIGLGDIDQGMLLSPDETRIAVRAGIG